MNAKPLLILCAAMLASALAGNVHGQQALAPYVRVAQIEIDPAQTDRYVAAAKEVIETSVRTEPGVLALYSVAEKENPAHIIVFEMYADREAYQAHLETEHFKTYKALTQNMVRSLKLADTIPIALSSKAKQ
jgi:quinol monooxygenase YgiN